MEIGHWSNYLPAPPGSGSSLSLYHNFPDCCLASTAAQRMSPTGAATDVTPVSRLPSFPSTMGALSRELRYRYAALPVTGSTSLGINLSGPPAIGTVGGSMVLL